jgi:predicted dehydrogenase
MRAGKDVYCEKPLTLTMEESRQITAATSTTKRIFQVGTQQRTEFDQVFLKAVAIARSGRLGNPLVATSSVGKATSGGAFPVVPVPSHLDFDFWLGQSPCVEFCAERVGWNFRWWLEYSGGQVTDWGVHHTDIALWALQGEETGVVEVSGHGDFPGLPYTVNVIDFLNHRVRLPHQYNVAESFHCELILPNGNRIQLTSGENELLVEGPDGRIRVNRNGLTGKPVEEIMQDTGQQERLQSEVHALYRKMPITSHMGNFIHCLKTREMPISDVWTHCRSVNACHMANIAMLTKQRLKFDPDQYQFDHPVANQLMSRQQRSPWQTSV